MNSGKSTIAKFPRLEALREQLLGEVLVVYKQTAWQEAFYSRNVLPHTFAQWDRFPEMHRMSEVFPLYQPQAPK